MEKRINNNKILIISHISDPDGCGSVVLANLAFEKVDYLLIKVNEQEEMLEFIKENEYKQIYICDIALKDNIGDEINALNLNLLHFDHHKTGEYVNKYPFANVKTTINERLTSAAELFYLYLVKEKLLEETKAITTFVELIRSYDTWDWKKDNNTMASDLSTLFSVIGHTSFIDTFSKSLKEMDDFFFSEQEKYLVYLKNQEINEYIDACQKSVLLTSYENYKVGITFNDKYSSQIGDALCSKNDIDFIFMIDMVDNKVSLRSKDRADVSGIAKKFGGGGHKNAAGFSLNKENKLFLLNLIISVINQG